MRGEPYVQAIAKDGGKIARACLKERFDGAYYGRPRSGPEVGAPDSLRLSPRAELLILADTPHGFQLLVCLGQRAEADETPMTRMS
jgi:hypothetical protein